MNTPGCQFCRMKSGGPPWTGSLAGRYGAIRCSKCLHHLDFVSFVALCPTSLEYSRSKSHHSVCTLCSYQNCLLGMSKPWPSERIIVLRSRSARRRCGTVLIWCFSALWASNQYLETKGKRCKALGRPQEPHPACIEPALIVMWHNVIVMSCTLKPMPLRLSKLLWEGTQIY